MRQKLPTQKNNPFKTTLKPQKENQFSIRMMIEKNISRKFSLISLENITLEAIVSVHQKQKFLPKVLIKPSEVS